ncbi:6-bladed beta-propeller [Paraprevotella xylaniphila]|uniref:6-bladed beta-propeller n=1 Tax=Paraprevotella xylaniphila TaxID=454155 RepID=UPI00266B7025|nr:6-bladed beta-propeller [Paraprevotella xylaniphila]
MKNKFIVPTITLVVCIGIIILIQRFNNEDKNYPKGIEWNCTETQTDSFHLSGIVNNYLLIPLELNEKSTIGNIDKIVFSDSLIFILDSQIASGIFVFSIKDGKFIRKIGNIGNGRGEYHELCDFSIDSKEKIIYALCEKKRLLCFSFSGEYKEVKEIPFLTTNLEYLNNKFYFINGTPHEDNLYITDTKFNVLSTYFPNDEYGENRRRLIHPFQKTSNGILYRRFLDNNIYKIDDNNNLSILYTFNFGRKELNIKDIKNITHSQLKNMMSQSKCHIKYFTEGKDYSVALFFDEDKPCISIYDKKKNEIFTHDYTTMKNDLMDLSFPLIEFTTSEYNFISVLYYQDIEKLMDNNILDKNIYLQDSNPILCIFK